MKREKVTIQAPTTSKNSEAIVKRSWSNVVTLEGVLLPFGNERALREYGFTENVRFRFFYKGQHPELKVGNQIVHNGKELPIVYVADYVKAMDVLLNTRESSAFVNG